MTSERASRSAPRVLLAAPIGLRHLRLWVGVVAASIARELRHGGEEVVVIDVLPESFADARRDGFLVVEGDATLDSTLMIAGIDRAKGLITTIDSDANNVYVTLSARALNEKLFLV